MKPFLLFLHTSLPSTPLVLLLPPLLALLWPTYVPPRAHQPLSSQDCATLKSPSELQASRWVSWRCHLHHKPAPPLTLTNTHTHTLFACNIQAKPEPPTVALLLSRAAFYIMCASGPFRSVFFLTTMKCQDKSSVCQPCLGLPAESHSNHFYTHRFWVNYKPKNVSLALTAAVPLVTYLLPSECDIHPPLSSHAPYGMWIHMLSICQGSPQKQRFFTAIILESLTVQPDWAAQGWLAADSNQLQNDSLFSTFACINI